jgi:putative membrane protein
MLEALQQFHWQRLVVFMLGGLIGLISFTRLLNWLLRQYHDLTMALLAGFMLGSLPKTWPWKQLIQSSDAQPLIEQNVSPVKYQLLAQQDPLILEALLWMSLGCLLVVLLEKLAATERHRHRFL